jgi:hypothetical protein
VGGQLQLPYCPTSLFKRFQDSLKDAWDTWCPDINHGLFYDEDLEIEGMKSSYKADTSIPEAVVKHPTLPDEIQE